MTSEGHFLMGRQMTKEIRYDRAKSKLDNVKHQSSSTEFSRASLHLLGALSAWMKYSIMIEKNIITEEPYNCAQKKEGIYTRAAILKLTVRAHYSIKAKVHFKLHGL